MNLLTCTDKYLVTETKPGGWELILSWIVLKFLKIRYNINLKMCWAKVM